MAKKAEAKEAKKSELTVWASPAWKLEKSGTQINLISGCGFFSDKKDGLVELQITIEEK